MNSIDEKIENILSLLKEDEEEEALFELQNSPLDLRIKLAKEGILLDVLYKDKSKEVRLEVAKHATQLYELKTDRSWEVKLEVYRQTNFTYMDFDDIYEENIEIQKEALKKGDIQNINSITNSYELSKIAVNNFNCEQLEKMFKSTKYNEIEILCVRNGFAIGADSQQRLLRNWDFRVWCIENERFINKIFTTYKTSTRTLLELLKNGYKEFHHNGDTVLSCAIIKNSKEIINWMIENHEHLAVAANVNDIESVKKLIEITSNVEVLEFVIENKTIELAKLASNRLNSIETDDNIISIDSRFKNVKKL